MCKSKKLFQNDFSAHNVHRLFCKMATYTEEALTNMKEIVFRNNPGGLWKKLLDNIFYIQSPKLDLKGWTLNLFNLSDNSSEFNQSSAFV